MKQARAEQRKQGKIKRREKAVELQMALEDRAAARRLLEELAELARGSRRWAAKLRAQARPERSEASASPVTKRLTRSAKATRSPTGEARPASSWVIDDFGMRGVIWQQSYLGRKSPNFYRGAARDNWEYIARDEAVLLDAAGEPIILSNMGEDWVEIGAAWQAMEDASTRKNAKIQILAIAPFDSDMSQDEMVAALDHFCTTVLDPLGLPYSAAIHAPPEHGDERNFHPHIAFSLRPMRRVEPYTWEVADDVCGELDGKDGVQTLRHLWAHSMSEAAEQARRNMRYTGLGYGARGLDHEAGVHLGEGLSSIVARGGHVWAHERNRIKNARNAARRRIRDLDQKIVALTKIRDAAVARLITRLYIERPPRRLVVADSVHPRLERRTATPTLPQADRLTAAAPVSVQQARLASCASALPESCVSSAGLSPPTFLTASTAFSRPKLRTKGAPTARAAAPPLRIASHAAVPITLTNAGSPIATPRRLEVAAVPETIRRMASHLPMPPPWALVAWSSAGRDEGRALTSVRAASPPVARHTVATDRLSPPDPVIAHVNAMLLAMRVTQERRAARERLKLHARREGALPVMSRSPVPRDTIAAHIPAGSDDPAPSVIERAARWRAARIRSHTERQRAAVAVPSRLWLERNPRQPWSDAAAKANALDHRRLAHLDRIDVYVADLRDGNFDLDVPAIKAIGVEDDWVRRADVQEALALLRGRQQVVMTALAAEAERRPLAFARTGTRFWPRNLEPADLARLDRWARDPGFQQDVFAIERVVRAAHLADDAQRRVRQGPPLPAPQVEVHRLAKPMPDGLGGTRDTPPPIFEHRDVGPRVHAFEPRTGRPSRSLLELLRFCGEQPQSIAFANDGKLIGLPGTPVLIDPLIRMWRGDERVAALMAWAVRASREAGRPVYPAAYAADIRALSPSPLPARSLGDDRGPTR